MTICTTWIFKYSQIFVIELMRFFELLSLDFNQGIMKNDLPPAYYFDNLEMGN